MLRGHSVAQVEQGGERGGLRRLGLGLLGGSVPLEQGHGRGHGLPHDVALAHDRVQEPPPSTATQARLQVHTVAAVLVVELAGARRGLPGQRVRVLAHARRDREAPRALGVEHGLDAVDQCRERGDELGVCHWVSSSSTMRCSMTSATSAALS